MSPPTQWAILCIELAIIFALAFAWNCTASYARHLEKRRSTLLDELLEMTSAAAFWQQEAGRNAEDAGKWRLAREARRRNRAQAQRAPILAMAERLRGELKVTDGYLLDPTESFGGEIAQEPQISATKPPESTLREGG